MRLEKKTWRKREWEKQDTNMHATKKGTENQKAKGVK
jgi:hypothetical protein